MVIFDYLYLNLYFKIKIYPPITRSVNIKVHQRDVNNTTEKWRNILSYRQKQF